MARTSGSRPGPEQAPAPSGAAAFLPAARDDLDGLRTASAACEGCDLFERATQTVFGEGDPDAAVMIVGEQPGDREDRSGHPFVGPAGRLLDDALEKARLPRDTLYVANAVKHFKWTAKGKVRLHQKPSSREALACSPWLLAEIVAVDPRLIVCLGATASQTLLGRTFRVTRQRDEILRGPRETPTMATVHPSSILRQDDDDARAEEFDRFVDDLRGAAAFLGARPRR